MGHILCCKADCRTKVRYGVKQILGTMWQGHSPWRRQERLSEKEYLSCSRDAKIVEMLGLWDACHGRNSKCGDSQADMRQAVCVMDGRTTYDSRSPEDCV